MECTISTALQTDTQQASPGGQQAQQYDGRGTNVFAIVRHIECMKSIPVLNDAEENRRARSKSRGERRR